MRTAASVGATRSICRATASRAGPWPTSSPNAPARVTSSRRYSFSSSSFACSSSICSNARAVAMAAAAWSAIVRSQPMHSAPDGPAGEHGQHAEHLPAVDQRLAREPAGPLRPAPSPGRATQSGKGSAEVGGLDRLAGGRDPADLPHAQRECGGTPRPVRVHSVDGDRRTARRWPPGAGTRSVPRHGLGRGAAGAVRGRSRQPDAGQGDPRRAAQAGDDQPEQFGQRMLLGHVQQQPLGVRQQRFLSRVVAHTCHFTNFRDF